ncbi:urease accessory protein UreF [Phenylobacterium sp.]|uniref:urease accessory protein UreF n=1 Tax=Phenylobacterium sp. TaxID=1871053 RepID=UPI002734D7D1|nr:urease accessory UreF family protein [Phenylobacterium sp.]MDP3660321.1 urease accessory UreF family protein [Phenylobacterium sp.]
MDGALLYDLLSWMSPSYPIGAFSHSGGLEWAVEEGLAVDRATTQAWVLDWMTLGGGRSEARLFAFAHGAAARGDRDALLEIAELAQAMGTSHERRLETTAQGAAFRRIARAAAPCLALTMLDSVDDEDLAYPVVAACLMAGHGAPLDVALTAYLHGVVSNLASAAQRLIPLGQTDGQLLIAGLRQPAIEAARDASLADPADPFAAMGQAGLIADFAAMAHETQYTRLFRT